MGKGTTVGFYGQVLLDEPNLGKEIRGYPYK